MKNAWFSQNKARKKEHILKIRKIENSNVVYLNPMI